MKSPNIYELTSSEELKSLFSQMRKEDLGEQGDITSRLFIPEDETWAGTFRLRGPGVVSGLQAIDQLIDSFSAEVTFSPSIEDGEFYEAGKDIAKISGNRRDILATERSILNFLSHLSGISTLTREYVKEARFANPNVKICETRKTTPGLRNLEKYATLCGGAHPHRQGLFDAVLIKDNHLAGVSEANLSSAIESALVEISKINPAPQYVMVEVDSLTQLEQVLETQVDIVLLDNMSPELLKEAVARRNQKNKKIALEASGGINLQTIRAVAESGVDRISVGALTHSSKALDIGLDEE